MRRSCVCWFNTTTCHIAKLSWQCEHIQLKIMVLLKIVYLQQYSVHKYVFTYTIAWGCWEYGVLKKWIILNQEISHFQGFYSQCFFFLFGYRVENQVCLSIRGSYKLPRVIDFLLLFCLFIPSESPHRITCMTLTERLDNTEGTDTEKIEIEVFFLKKTWKVMHRKLGSQRHRVRDKSWKCKYKLIRKLLFFPDDRHSAALTCFWLVSRSGFDLKVTLWHKSVLAH